MSKRKDGSSEKNFSFTVFREAARTFRPAFRGQRRTIVASVLLTLIVIGIDLLKPWPMKYIFDEVLAHKPGDATPGGLSLVQLAGLATAAFVVIYILTSWLSERCSIVVSGVEKQVTIRVRRQVFEHLHRLHFPFHQSVKSGDLLQRIMGDVNGVRRLIYSSWVSLGERVVVVASTAVVMFILDPWFAGLALLPLPLHAAIVSRYSARLKECSRKQRRSEGSATSVATESLRQIRLVKAFAVEDRVGDMFAREANRSEEYGAEAARLSARQGLVTDIVNAAGVGAVLLVGAVRVIGGASTPGELLVLVTYARSLYRPIGKMSTDGGRLATAAVSAERLLDILEIEPEDPGKGRPAPRFAGEVVFQNVHFQHPGGLEALKDVSFTIPAGSLALMSGPNGSGKSTSVSAILRLITPQSGAILIDGEPAESFQLDSYRRNFGYVPQEVHLFGATLRENVLYGRPDATQEEIDDAARKALLDDVIDRLPGGWDEVIGEGGTTLSGGEARRLMLARAALRDARILLLDEPLTGLDPEAREVVGHAIRHIAAGRTALVVSHGPASELEPDQIIRLDEGRCVEGETPIAASSRWAAGEPPASVSEELERLLSDDSALALFRDAGLKVSSVERTFTRVRQDLESGASKGALVGFDFMGQAGDGEELTLPGYVRLSLDGEAGELVSKMNTDTNVTPFGAGVRSLPGTGGVLFLFPYDAKLPGLGVMAGMDQLHTVLQELAEFTVLGWRVVPEESKFFPVRYRPERRFLGRAHLTLENSRLRRRELKVFLRYFPDDRGFNLADMMRSLREEGDFRHTPRPLGALLAGRLFVEEWVEGELFLPLLNEGRADPIQLAETLRQLHQTPVKLGPHVSPKALLDGLKVSLQKLAREPQLAGPAERVSERLTELLPEGHPVVPIHGDLHPEQILIKERGPVLVDFERAGMGDPYQDLGNLVAHLLRLAEWQKGSSSEVMAFTGELIDAYRKGQDDRPPGDLAFFVGRSMAVRARAAIRRQEDGRVARAKRALELAEVVMARPA